MTSKFTCDICMKAVAKYYNAVYCDICNSWVYINKILLQKTSTDSRMMVLSKMHKTKVATTSFRTYSWSVLQRNLATKN